MGGGGYVEQKPWCHFLFSGSHTEFLNKTEAQINSQYTRDDGITLEFTTPSFHLSREYCTQSHRIQLGCMTCVLALQFRMYCCVRTKRTRRTRQSGTQSRSSMCPGNQMLCCSLLKWITLPLSIIRPVCPKRWYLVCKD